MWHRVGEGGKKYWGQDGAGIVFTDGNSILLLKRSGNTDNKGSWACPGGKREEGETYLTTAQRETMEEIGHMPKCTRITEIDDNDGYHFFKTYVCGIPHRFLCSLSDEHDEYKWFGLEELKQLDLHPRLKSVVPTIVSSISRFFKNPIGESHMSGFAATIDFSELAAGASTGAIYTGGSCGPDCQWLGAPESMNPQKRKPNSKRKKERSSAGKHYKNVNL